MDDKRIAELLEICEAATEGPWQRGGCDSVWHHLDTSRTDRDAFVQISGPCSGADGTFVVAARTALPEALAALVDARRELGEMRTRLGAARNTAKAAAMRATKERIDAVKEQARKEGDGE